MNSGIEKIGKRDVIWSYSSTIFTVGAGVILLPFIVCKMSADTVGVWNIFQTITALVLLLDFGFRPSFARNVSYILSGVHTLQREGVEKVENCINIDYTLLKETISVMKKFYALIAIVVFLLLLGIGTPYLIHILHGYSGDKHDAIAAWIVLCIINCYNFYTLYYDALLTGKGYIKRTQQITIIGQCIYLSVAICLIYAGFGLTAIVSGQLLSTIIRRILAYKTFYTKEMVNQLSLASSIQHSDVLHAIMPNAIKVGLTNLGSFLVNKSSIFIGGLFVSLPEIGMYGITLQVLDVLGRCGSVYYQSYVPQLAQFRANRDIMGLRKRYIYSVCSLLLIYILGGLVFIFFGNGALQLIHSNTMFLAPTMLSVMLLINFLEHNHVVAAGFIMADNKIPFFIPSIISGTATVCLLYISLEVFHLGLWGLILAPGLAQLAYQNWRWPQVVIRELWNNNEQL